MTDEDWKKDIRKQIDATKVAIGALEKVLNKSKECIEKHDDAQKYEVEMMEFFDEELTEEELEAMNEAL